MLDVELSGRVIEHEHGYPRAISECGACRSHAGVCGAGAKQSFAQALVRVGGPRVSALRARNRSPSRTRRRRSAFPSASRARRARLRRTGRRARCSMLAQFAAPLLVLAVAVALAVPFGPWPLLPLGQLAVVIWLLGRPWAVSGLARLAAGPACGGRAARTSLDCVDGRVHGVLRLRRDVAPAPLLLGPQAPFSRRVISLHGSASRGFRTVGARHRRSTARGAAMADPAGHVAAAWCRRPAASGSLPVPIATGELVRAERPPARRPRACRRAPQSEFRGADSVVAERVVGGVPLGADRRCDRARGVVGQPDRLRGRVLPDGPRGAQFASLMHEAAHRLLFANRRANDLVGRWLARLPGLHVNRCVPPRAHGAPPPGVRSRRARHPALRRLPDQHRELPAQAHA